MTNLVSIEQFAHGKLIDGDRDVRGFTIVARSPALPSDAQLETIRAQADVGKIRDLATYAGSDVAFSFTDYVVAGRIQRSPKRYDRGYFPQEHFLVLPQACFAALGNNYAYLHALLPASIPWRAHDETLPTLDVPVRAREQEIEIVTRTVQTFGEHLWLAVQSLLENRPFVVAPAPGMTATQIVEWLETVALLLPLNCRAQAAWAINVQNAQRCSAQLKIVTDPTADFEGHTWLSLAEPPAPTLSTNQWAMLYANTLRQYRARFPADITTLLQLIENLPAESKPLHEQSEALAMNLWKALGPLVLEYDWQKGAVPNLKNFLENMLPMLNEPGYNLTPERRSQFLVALIDGVLNGVMPLAEVKRVPSQAPYVQPQSFWAELDRIFSPTATEPRASNRWQVLLHWQSESAFWNEPQVRGFVTRLLVRELEFRAPQPNLALEFLRWCAQHQLTPMKPAAQINLINCALSKQSTIAPFRRELLLGAWADLATSYDDAMQIAKAVPALSYSLWQEPKGPFSFIAHALAKADPMQMTQMLGALPPAQGNEQADLFLSLALMGERIHIAGFRAPQILRTIALHALRLSDRVTALLDTLGPKLGELSPESCSVLAEAMFAVGQPYRFKPLLAVSWRWIDTLIDWLARTPYDAAYQTAIAFITDWFKSPPADCPPNERAERLHQVFGYWTNWTRGTPQAVNQLMYLVLAEAFSEHVPVDKGWFKKEDDQRIKRATDALAFVRANAASPTQWSSEFTTAYQNLLSQIFALWAFPKLTRRLIGELKQRKLDFEFQYLRVLNAQQHGGEIIKELVESLEAFESARRNVEEVAAQAEVLTPEQVAALLPEPAKRAELRYRLQNARVNVPALMQGQSSRNTL